MDALIMIFILFRLEFVLATLIVVAYKHNVNPDNLATPLAASIGDVIAITLLSIITAALYTVICKSI